MIISAIFYGIGRHEEISKSIGQNDGIVYRAVQCAQPVRVARETKHHT